MMITGVLSVINDQPTCSLGEEVAYTAAKLLTAVRRKLLRCDRHILVSSEKDLDRVGRLH